MSLMKHAVIVYGQRFAGTNYTLNCHFKPLVKLSGGQRVFHVKDTDSERLVDGEIRTQSFEDAGYSVQSVIRFIKSKLICRDRLVIVTQPPEECGSLFHAVKDTLKQAGYDVMSVEIKSHGGVLNPAYYAGKAQQILGYI